MTSHRRAVALTVLLLINVGCLKTVTFRTVIEEDGAVERHITIKSTGKAGTVDSDLVLPKKDGWQVYKKKGNRFEVRGKFKSVADIPLDFEKVQKIGEDDKRFKDTSKSIKTYRVFRCALFSVHDYTETIQDITSWEQFQQAADTFIGMRRHVYELAETLYGDKYDFAAARAYVEREVVPRARELATRYWLLRSDKRADLKKAIPKLYLDWLRDLGVPLPRDAKEADDKVNGIAEAWLRAKVIELIRPKKGGKMSAAEAKRLVEELEAWDAEPPDGRESRVQVAADAIIKKHYGDPKKFEDVLMTAGLRLAGAYLQILSHGFQFDARVTMPGQIVETNGLINDNTVSWSFTHEQIFPRYEMRVRSVAFARGNDLGDGRSLITSTVHALRLAKSVEKLKPADRKLVMDAIAAAAKARSAEPLRKAAQGNSNVSEVLERIGLRENGDR